MTPAPASKAIQSSPTKSSAIISVLIVDDHPVACDGLKNYLETTDDIKVVGTCSRGEEVVDAVKSLSPDIVILDLVLNGSQIDGVEVANLLRHTNTNVKILVVSAHYGHNHVLGSIKAGVDGYVLKLSSRIEIVQAVRVIASGKKLYDPKIDEIIRLYLDQGSSSDSKNVKVPFEGLTEREMEVLEHLSNNKSNLEIAEELSIAIPTVKTHLNNIYSKIGVSNRTQAKLWFYYNNLHSK